MEAVAKEYKTIQNIQGPLVFVKTEEPVGYKELVTVRLSDGSIKNGEVLDSANGMVVIQIFEGTSGIDRSASVKFPMMTNASLPRLYEESKIPSGARPSTPSSSQNGTNLQSDSQMRNSQSGFSRRCRSGISTA